MNAMKVGFQLFKEIEAARTSGEWRWEKSLPGPLSYEEVTTIATIGGCWCDEPSAAEGESVRFYSNQNHPAHNSLNDD